MSRSICFYFQVHQPFRLKKYSFFQAQEDHEYFFPGPEGYENQFIFEKVANKCYLPMTELLLRVIERHPEFHASFSLSGVFVEQCLAYGEVGKRVLENFQALVKTGRVELLSETYYHSLSFLHAKDEFTDQVWKHYQLMQELFGYEPKVFRNTELIYSDELAEFIRRIGFKGILAEGWPPALGGQSPNYVRRAKRVDLHAEDIKIAKRFAPINFFGFRSTPKQDLAVLTKNYQLSDDLAFRFGDKNWEGHPLFADKFAHWVGQQEGDTVNLFMDFETFGEHQWEDTGIFDFMEHLPQFVLEHGIEFKTPSQVIDSYPLTGEFSSHHYLSWADEARDVTAWLENDLQKSAFDEIARMEQYLHKWRNSKQEHHKALIEDFRKLQTSDHLYYMSTKFWADGDVHTYFSPYGSPYDAFINYMNVMEALRRRARAIESDGNRSRQPLGLGLRPATADVRQEQQ